METLIESSRWEILKILREKHKVTLQELTRILKLSPLTIRHHLNVLRFQNLITYREIRGKIGRPYYLYSLTEDAHNLFPQRYDRLLDRILSQFKSLYKTQELVKIIAHISQDILRGIRKTKIKSLGGKQELLMELLMNEGFLVRKKKTGLELVGCPYPRVAKNHPEICSLELKYIPQFFHFNPQKISCSLRK